MNSREYVVISPVRDEEAYLALTIKSVSEQTVLPSCWVIVNDGSTDSTGAIAETARRQYPWIRVVHRPDRGSRKAGGGVVEAFYEGFAQVGSCQWQYVVKLDGDLSFDKFYFEHCLEMFFAERRLGIAGGTICCEKGGQIAVECPDDPRFHVRGATKVYRRECWEKIGGLIKAPGWDTIDEVKANMLGWETRTISSIRAIHHRHTGAAYGAWSDRVKNGTGCYITGYHPLFMLLKCLKRIKDRPYFLSSFALLFGFTKAYISCVPRVMEKDVLHYFRQQQINRLLLKKSIWG